MQPSPWPGLLSIVAIFGIFYFLLFLPMQRQKKQTQQMLKNLKNGDDVVTTGGLIGTVSAINTEDDTLILRLKPDNLKVQISRSAVAGILGSKSS